jgi:hypothetical protein
MGEDVNQPLDCQHVEMLQAAGCHTSMSVQGFTIVKCPHPTFVYWYLGFPGITTVHIWTAACSPCKLATA